MSKELPARASLENLRKQAKGLHKAFRDGDDDAVARIRNHLPRAASLDDGDLRALDLSLQETQHVLAREYGQATWDALRAAVETAGFEDLARLTDREAQTLLREISQKDLCRALIGASDAVRGRMLSNMSKRVRTFIVEESERLARDLPAHEPMASQQRLIEWAESLAGNGQIPWPPPDDAEPFDGDVEAREKGTENEAEDPLGGLAYEDLEPAELGKVFAELGGVARHEGVLALQRYVPERARQTPLLEAIGLLIDGTNPDIIDGMLRRRIATMLHNRRTRLEMIAEGLMSLQRGDNPWIIQRRMQAFYLESGQGDTPARLNEEITGDELCDWFARGWLLVRSPSEIALTFLHLALAARNAGLAALAPSIEAIEDPMLKTGLQQLLKERDADRLTALLTAMVTNEIALTERHHHAALQGVMMVQAGREPDEIARDVEAAAAG